MAVIQDRDIGCAGVQLETRVRRQAGLDHAERDQMHALMSAHFENVNSVDFQRDLAEKEWVVTVTDRDRGILGFTTVMRLSVDLHGERFTALFSGDTILDPQIWGAGTWIRVLGRHADATMASIKERPVYWLLLTSTHRTYRALPALLKDYYPHPSWKPPPILQERIDALVRLKFPNEYDPVRGIVRPAKPTPVRADRIPLVLQGMSDPIARSFVDWNPGFLNGDYLVCIGELDHGNRTRLGARLLRQ